MVGRNKKTKAFILLSGGLDSILATKLLMTQGIKIEGICFYSNFFNCDLARKAARWLGIKLREVDISEEFLGIVKKPKYGYGVGLNPCIDCHALMLKKAGKIMRQEGFDFVATGEVLNERPMSQNKQALKIVEKEAGLEGYLLRPLSAKLLESTIPEKKGLVDREKLMDILGRSRKRQMELTQKYGIKDYPTPAGGCALTQSGFVNRLKELVDHKPNFNPSDVELVKIGRHFWDGRTQIILGRNQEENERLHKLKDKNDIIMEPDGFVGPTGLICFPRLPSRAKPSLTWRSRGISSAMNFEEMIEKAKGLIIKHSPKTKGGRDLNFKINGHCEK